MAARPSVDLPAPDSPISPSTSPRCRSRSTPLTISLQSSVAVAALRSRRPRDPVRTSWRVIDRHRAHSFRPLARCSIQSTTKLTPPSAARWPPPGSSGVMSPKMISVAFSLDHRAPVGRSAAGCRGRGRTARDDQEDEAEAQAELGHQRRQDVGQDLAPRSASSEPLAAQPGGLDEVQYRRRSCATARVRRKTAGRRRAWR